MQLSLSSWFLALVSAAALIALSGCSKTASPDKDKLTVGFIYVGAKDDYGYNQAHAEGAAAVKKMPASR